MRQKAPPPHWRENVSPATTAFEAVTLIFHLYYLFQLYTKFMYGVHFTLLSGFGSNSTNKISSSLAKPKCECFGDMLANNVVQHICTKFFGAEKFRILIALSLYTKQRIIKNSIAPCLCGAYL